MGEPTDTRWPPQNISPHFALHEFAQPAGYGLPSEPYPEALVQPCLVPLCRDVLEIVRAELGGRRIDIAGAGGWRSEEYNARHRAAHPGVAQFSQHMRGRAADIEVDGMAAHVVHDRVLAMWQAGKLPALGGLGRYPGFTHLDIRPHQAGELARWDG